MAFLFNMAGEAPRRERVARPLVEGRVAGVRRDERGLAHAVDLDSSAAGDVVQRALAPWFGTGTFNAHDSVGRRAVLAALAAALEHDDAGTRLTISREVAKLLDGSRDLPGDVETTLAACRATNSSTWFD